MAPVVFRFTGNCFELFNIYHELFSIWLSVCDNVDGRKGLDTDICCVINRSDFNRRGERGILVADNGVLIADKYADD